MIGETVNQEGDRRSHTGDAAQVAAWVALWRLLLMPSVGHRPAPGPGKEAGDGDGRAAAT